MNNIKLNTEQNRLKLDLLFWIANNDIGYYGILGAGGTGKTFTITNIFSEIAESVIFLGATNKVVTVLKESLINNGMENPIQLIVF
jgi:excinuclease UvrABC helicase subunit UvrB